MNKLIQNLKKKLKAISVAGFEGINAAEPDSDNEQLVNVELSRLLAWRILVSSRSSFLGYFTLAYLLKNSVSRYALCIWVGLLVCMELFNVVVQLKFLRVLNDRSRRTEWLAFYPIPLFMTGVLWGIVGVLPGVMSDPWMFMLTLLFLIAVSIFSVHNLCFYRKMLSAFTVGLAVPVMVNGLLNPSSFQLMICFAACIFLVMIHIYGLTIRDLYLHDIRSRLLAQKMAAQIKKSNEELSQALIKVSELATRDSLTGCLNRRSLLEILDHEVERISRTRQCVGIIMFDLDHFNYMLWTGSGLCFIVYGIQTSYEDKSNLYLAVVLIAVILITAFFNYH